MTRQKMKLFIISTFLLFTVNKILLIKIYSFLYIEIQKIKRHENLWKIKLENQIIKEE
jgi:hypothetical protein